MKTAYQFGSFDNRVEFTVDDEMMTIVIKSGKVKSKEDFLKSVNEYFLLALINQIKLHLNGEQGCVDPYAYDILASVTAGDLQTAKSIALKAFHKWDHYKIFVELQ